MERNPSPSIDFCKVTVAAETILESRGARGAVFDQRFAAVVPLLYQCIANREALAFDCGAPIYPHAHGRKACNVLGQLFRLCAYFTIRHEIFAEPDSETFLCWNLATGQNDFERPALADDAGQTDSSAIDQRYAPAATVNAKIGIFLHHPEITPQRKLHPTRDGRAGYGRNDGFIQFEPRWPQRTTRDLAAIATRSCGRNIQLPERMALIERANVL